MALTRHWYPTSNKSSRSGDPRLLVIHTTEGFTGTNGMYDCAIYFQGPVGASSHAVIDNFHPGHICECVSPSYASWTQCNYNSATAASVEQCGYAAWSRSTWLNDKMPLLENVAAWLAEESKRWGIPLTDLSSSSAQGSGRGVCYHMDLGSAGCGHGDPGSGYPLDVVLDMARGGGAAAPEGVSLNMVAVKKWQGQNYYAALNMQGQVWFKEPGSDWFAIDANQTGAKSGPDLDIDDPGNVTVSFTNKDNAAAKYDRKPGGGDWGFATISPPGWFR